MIDQPQLVYRITGVDAIGAVGKRARQGVTHQCCFLWEHMEKKRGKWGWGTKSCDRIYISHEDVMNTNMDPPKTLFQLMTSFDTLLNSLYMVGSQSMLVSGANAVLSHRVQTPCEVFISKPCTCQRKVWRSLPWRVWKIFGYLACRFCSGYHLANVQNLLASARELIDTSITCIFI